MTTTLWDLLVSEPSMPEGLVKRIERSPELEALRDELEGSVDASFWVSAPLAVIDGLRQILDLPVGDLLCRAWITHPGLRRQLESSIVPERLTLFDLGEHEITSRHRPRIDVRAQSRTLGSLPFDLSISLRVQLGRLQLQERRLMRATLGACWAGGTLRLGRAPLLTMDPREIDLPSPLSFDDGIPLQT